MNSFGRRILANDGKLLEMLNVDSGYGEIEVLRDVSIYAEKGQIVSIIGANGAGKSTLLKTLFGIVQPTRGQVFFLGDEISKKPPLDRLNSGISYVPEGRSNFPAMTVEENLQMGAYTRNDPKEISADIDVLCERFPILAEKRTTAAGNLSGGQQQMLEIAVALMLRPTVLLIDEPTLGLAPILVTEVFDELQKINQAGTTIVLVEQNAKRALEISDYAYVLELGKVRFRGAAAELAQDETIIEAYLGER
jgi:branched-chain amino acid transport system ATP-binding protein